MEPSMYLYNREKEAFIKIDRVNSKDVAFIVIPEEKKVIIWHGKESSRITQYKAGMKVTSLISEKQLYGFKHEVLKEGEEPEDLRDFLERNFGKRDLTQEEIAQKDRKLVQSKVERISKKYKEHEEPITSPRPAIDGPKEPEERQRGNEGEDTPIPVQAPVEAGESLSDDKPKPAEASIDDEIKKMATRIGSDSSESRATAFEKKNLTSDEREVMDEVKREQLKTDNLLNVEQVKILDQEKQEKLKQLESERIKKLEEEKGKVARMEEDRVTKEREFLENKLRKEKEAMMQERKALQEKLKEEEKKRQLQLEREREEREARKQEKMDFEMRKIDLRMKIRGEGVDYIPSPAENEQILYRIEDGKAVRCDTKVITSGMAYLLDMDDRVITWYGRDASLEDQFFTSEIAKLLEGKRDSSVDVVNIE
ncbi:hypothetical protein GF325_16050, partial [Candidatus Bathyarchaeota archaeon]|nr:hypothetical protein [Candidatus Bathyarchaeota archaeon]